MSSYFLNTLFSKYQPGEAWYPSGFEPLGPVGRGGGKNGSEPVTSATGAAAAGAWRGTYGTTYDGTNSSATGAAAANCAAAAAMSGTSFPGAYGYSACAFSQAYSQAQTGYQDQFGGGYPPGYAPNTFAPSWTTQSSKVVGSANPMNYGLDSAYCSPGTRDSNGVGGGVVGVGGDHDNEDEKEPLSPASGSDKKTDGHTYRGPVYSWMKIPGKLDYHLSKIRNI